MRSTYLARRSYRTLLGAGLFMIMGAACSAQTLTVSAAASLTDAFKQIGAKFEQKNRGTKVEFNFGASGTLAAQITQGAPVDVFASASQQDMDRLASANLIDKSTRKDFTSNGLVVITPAIARFKLKTIKDLASAGVTRIAIGNPETVPAGRYAKQAFDKAGIWSAVQPKLALAADVRQARTYVQRGEVDAGVVFASDSKADGIGQVVPIADKLHDAIRYPAAVVKDSKVAAVAKKFVAYLTSGDAKAILAQYGFRK